MIHILLIDDDVSFPGVIQDTSGQDKDFIFEKTFSAEEALEKLNHSEYDLIVSNYSLPDMDGIDLLKTVRSKLGNIPFIFLITKEPESLSPEAYALGAEYSILTEGTLSSWYSGFIHQVTGMIGRRESERRLLTLNRVYSVLFETSKAVRTCRTRIELFQEICRILVEKGDFRMVWIGLADPIKKSIEPVASHGIVDGYLDHIEISTENVPRGQGPTGTAFREGRIYVTNDMIQDPNLAPWRDACIMRGYRANAAFPFALGTRNAGVLSVYATVTGFYTDEIVNLLEELTKTLDLTLTSFDDLEEKRKLEDALRGSEAHYRLLVENSSDIIVVVQGPVLKFANQRTSRILGFTHDELVTLPFITFIHPDDRDLLNQTYQRRLHGEPVPDRYTFRLITKKGETRCMEVRSARITWDDEPAFLHFARDVTDIRVAEDALRESKRVTEESLELFKTLNENAPAGFAYMDTNFRFVHINETLAAINGLPVQDHIGRSVEEVVPSIWPLVKPVYMQVLESGEPVTNIELSGTLGGDQKEKRYWIGNYYPIRIKNNEILGIGVIVIDISERKRSEEAIKFQNTLLSTQQEVSIDGILVVDSSGDILSYNTQFVDLWDIPHEIIESRSDEQTMQSVLEKLVNPQEFKERIRYLYEHREEKSRDEIHLRSGKILDRYSSPMFGNDGEYYGRLWNFRDITVQKIAETSLREKEESLREAQRIAHLGSWDMDVRTGEILWSEEMFRILGYEPNSIQPRYDSLDTIILPEDLDPMRAAVTESFTNNLPFEFILHIIRPDGQKRILLDQGIPICDDAGNIVRMIGTALDITERVHQENVLRETNEYLDNLISHANVPIIVWDPAFHITLFNHAFELLTGRSAENVIGKPLNILFPPDQTERCMRLINVTSDGVMWETVELPILHQDGSIRIAVWNSSTIYSTDGSTQVATIAQGRDITAEKMLEQEKEVAVLQIQENIAKLAILNDNIRNPLMVISLYAGSAGNEEVAQIIHHEVMQIDSMVNELDNAWVHSDKILAFLTKHESVFPEFPAHISEQRVQDGDRVLAFSGESSRHFERSEYFVEELQAQLYTILDSIDAIVYVADIETYDLLYMNAQARALYGNVTGKKCYNKIYNNQNTPCSFCNNHQLINSEGPIGVVQREFLNPGTGRWFDCRDRAIRWTDGRLVRLEIATDITDLKNSQESLENSELRLRTVFESIPAGIIIADVKTRHFFFVNEAMCRMLGYSREEFSTLSVPDIHPVREHASVMAEFEKMLSGESVFVRDLPVLCKDGRIFFADIKSSLLNLDGRESIIGVFIDDTKRREAEMRVQLQLTRLSSFLTLLGMVDASEQEIMNYTLEISCTVSESPFAFVGLLSPDEYEMIIHAWSKTAMEVCSVMDKPIHFPIDKAGIWGECIRNRAPSIINDYSAFHPAKHGYPEGHVPVTRYLGVPVYDGTQIVAILAVANKETDYQEEEVQTLMTLGNLMWEIIHRKQAEESLRESEDKYHLAMDATTDGLWDWNISSGFVSYNLMWKTMLGLSDVAPELETWVSRVHIDDKEMLLGGIQEILDGKTEYLSLEHRIQTEDGTWIWVLGRGRVVSRDPKGRPIRMIGTMKNITARKEIEIELRNSETRLGLVLDVSLMGTWELNLIDHTAYRNLRHDQIFGYDHLLPEWSYEIFLTYVVPEDRMEVNRRFTTAISEKKDWEFDCRIQRADAEIAWIMARGQGEYDEQGNPVRMLGIVQDITDRKLTELRTQRLLADITKERERFFSLINSIPDEVWFADAEGRFTLINPTGLKEFGLDDGEDVDVEALAKSLEILRPDGTPRPSDEAPPLRALSGEILHSVEEIIRTPASGELRYRQVSSSPVRDDSGSIIGSVSVVRDITEHKKNEEILKENEERFSNAFESAAIGMALVSPEGRFLKVNQSLCKMVGYDEADLLAKTFQDITHPDDLETDLEFVHRMLFGEILTYQMEKRYLHNSGQIIWALLSVSLVRDSRGNPLYFVSQIENSTERKRSEEALIQANRQISLLTEITRHDIMNVTIQAS